MVMFLFGAFSFENHRVHLCRYLPFPVVANLSGLLEATMLIVSTFSHRLVTDWAFCSVVGWGGFPEKAPYYHLVVASVAMKCCVGLLKEIVTCFLLLSLDRFCMN